MPLALVALEVVSDNGRTHLRAVVVALLEETLLGGGCRKGGDEAGEGEKEKGECEFEVASHDFGVR